MEHGLSLQWHPQNEIIFCPASVKDQNPIFHPPYYFVSMACNEHCSLVGSLTRQETIVFFSPLLFPFDCYISWPAYFPYFCLLVPACVCVKYVVEWGGGGEGNDVITFGPIRDLLFEHLVNFSHSASFCVFSSYCFRCANKPNQTCSLHTGISASNAEQLLQSSNTTLCDQHCMIIFSCAWGKHNIETW